PHAVHLSCPKCAEIVLRFQDSKRLHEDAIAIYRKKHGLLSADEIRAIRERFGLTQADLAFPNAHADTAHGAGLRAVHIVTADDTEVIIPHSRLWSTSIFNASSGSQGLLCVAHYYLQPDHDGAAV